MEACLHALLTMSQAVTIGRYLDGSYGMIRLHANVASSLILVAVALAVVAVVYTLAGGRLWVGGACLLFFFAEGFQTGMGYAGRLNIQVPLGVAIVAGALGVAVWSWSRAAARPRATRRGRGPSAKAVE